MKKNVIEGPNKTRLLNGLLAVLLAITLIAPAVFQSTTPANARKTGDYESDRYQEFRNGHMELPTFLYHLFYLPHLFFFRMSFHRLKDSTNYC